MSNEKFSLYDALMNGADPNELKDLFYKELDDAVERVYEARLQEKAAKEAEKAMAAKREELEAARQEVANAINKYLNLIDGNSNESIDNFTGSLILDYLNEIEKAYERYGH